MNSNYGYLNKIRILKTEGRFPQIPMLLIAPTVDSNDKDCREDERLKLWSGTDEIEIRILNFANEKLKKSSDYKQALTALSMVTHFTADDSCALQADDFSAMDIAQEIHERPVCPVVAAGSKRGINKFRTSERNDDDPNLI